MVCGLRLHSKWKIFSEIFRMVHSGDYYNRTPVLLKHSSFTTLNFVKMLCYDISSNNIDAFKNEKKLKEFSECPVPKNCVQETKLIRVSIVGSPNAGKSTFINRLINRRVFPVSSKVHTTRRKAKAILNDGNVQVILLDTPGIVDVHSSKRHNLEKSFLVDAELSIKESDLIAVIHDVSNAWTRDQLDLKILRLLNFHQDKSSVLILNKVDAVKSKRKLLDLTRSLTCGSLKSDTLENPDHIENGLSEELVAENLLCTEKANYEAVVHAHGWPNFERVFMISSLKGIGLNDVKDFILQKSIPGSWMYSSSVYTDQKIEEMVHLAIREKLLELLPKEIPYNVKISLEHLHISETGDVTAVASVYCSNKRQQKLVIGPRGKKIREIAKGAEEALENALIENVRLKLMVESKK